MTATEILAQLEAVTLEWATLEAIPWELLCDWNRRRESLIGQWAAIGCADDTSLRRLEAVIQQGAELEKRLNASRAGLEVEIRELDRAQRIIIEVSGSLVKPKCVVDLCA